MSETMEAPTRALPTYPDLRGKVALVTGATSGLGEHFARLLAGQGVHVAAAGRRVERLGGLVGALTRDGVKATALKLDVTDIDSIRAAVDAAEAALGPVDILVNNAGINQSARAIDTTPELYDQILGTNLRGAFFMATEVARRLIARKAPGRVINIASIGAFRVLTGMPLYCMSKGGLQMMTKALAYEWARQDITVNAICPGFIETELTSDWFKTEKGQQQVSRFVRRRLEADVDLDGMLLLLASEVSRGITGSVIAADDGQSLGAV